MRQAVHIFVKDSRQFRYTIGILLAVTAVFGATGGYPWPVVEPTYVAPGFLDMVFQAFARYIFPIGWCFLIAQVIHAEALPGERQFWLTRPYHRGSLAAAKALFVLAYITVPFALAQAAIVMSSGLPLAPFLLGLLWEQVLIATVILLPAVALATVTSSLAQFAIAALVAPVLLVVLALVGSWLPFGQLEWIRYALAIGAAVVIAGVATCVQFARRWTMLARSVIVAGVAGGVLMVNLLPWSTAFALQARLAGDWDGHINATLVPPVPKGKPRMQTTAAGLQLSFRLSGQPEDTRIACEARQITLEAPGGLRWESRTIAGQSHVTPENECPVGLPVPRAFLDAVADQPVTLRAVLFNTVFSREQSFAVPIGQAEPTMTDASLCVALADEHVARLTCRGAFLDPNPTPWSVYGRRRTYSPFPADLRLHPLSQYGRAFAGPWNAGQALTVSAREPIAHVRTSVFAENLRLRDFEFGR